MTIQHSNGYSARIELHLSVNEQRVPVAQVGRDFFVLGEPCVVPPSTRAEIVVTVDEQVSRREVCLFEGIAAGQERVRFHAASE